MNYPDGSHVNGPMYQIHRDGVGDMEHRAGLMIRRTRG
jgi:hypothetical protein